MQNPALWCNILQEGMKEEGLGLQVQRDSRYEKPNPNPFYLCLGLIKPQMWYKSVLEWF